MKKDRNDDDNMGILEIVTKKKWFQIQISKYDHNDDNNRCKGQFDCLNEPILDWLWNVNVQFLANTFECKGKCQKKEVINGGQYSANSVHNFWIDWYTTTTTTESFKKKDGKSYKMPMKRCKKMSKKKDEKK